MSQEWTIEGNVWKVGDNVNTESITPSRWLHESMEAVMEHIGEILIPEFPKKVQKGDLWVGGSNLGCSSSRNAPMYLKAKGVGAVICHSASRIFYRNSINAGLPILEIGEDVEKLHMGDRARVDLHNSSIKNLTTGETLTAKPLPDFIKDLLKAGGVLEHIQNRYAKGELGGDTAC